MNEENCEQRKGRASEARSGGVDVGRDLIAPLANIGGRDIIINSPPGISDRDFREAFAPLMEAVQDAPAERKAEAEEKAYALQKEVAKGKGARDGRIAELVDELVRLVPGAVSAVASIFGQPVLGGLAGPVTKLVLDKIQGK